MIDNDAVSELAAIHPPDKKPACTIQDDLAYVHSSWFVLVVPAHTVTATKWPGRTHRQALDGWQDVDTDTRERAQAMQETWTYADGTTEDVVRLISRSFEAHIKEAIYQFVLEQIPSASFYLYSEDRKARVGIRANDRLAGVVAPVWFDKDAV